MKPSSYKLCALSADNESRIAFCTQFLQRSVELKNVRFFGYEGYVCMGFI